MKPKNTISNTISVIFLLIVFQKAIAQHNGHYHLDDHRNHLGLAVGPVYVPSEKRFAPGVHVHYIRLFDVKKSTFGVGFGFEQIYDEHKHHATSVNFSYLPIHNLTLSVSPGVQFGENSREFTTHFEASYEWVFQKLHFGSALEYAYAKSDAHAMLGLHVGFGF